MWSIYHALTIFVPTDIVMVPYTILTGHYHGHRNWQSVSWIIPVVTTHVGSSDMCALDKNLLAASDYDLIGSFVFTQQIVINNTKRSH